MKIKVDMRTLKLTLQISPFEVMKTGEKFEEFRKPSKWMMSRLLNKDGTPREYDCVSFSNGYGRFSPKFYAKYINWRFSDRDFKLTYSNGLVVNVDKGDVIITLGEVLSISTLCN